MPPELTLQQAGSRYHIPVRRLAFLLRSGLIEARHIEKDRGARA